ncbi:polysaccharide lyase [Halorussus sp. MSC15.2]|uniref:polysaccharide lyase n=1 Tax=Halorussus sp. MSC15.2 TaxID=2283638 RepID=UPI0013D53C44|nr:hypothetical protein [Halorussus sp. MSC15.2]NEU58096.1 hypothetical protein [Halorussus sp. MSC15.2]
MKPTRRRVLLGLGALAGGAGLTYAVHDDGRTGSDEPHERAPKTRRTMRPTRRGPNLTTEGGAETTGERGAETTEDAAETTTEDEDETTSERDVDFPERFVEFSFDRRNSLGKFTERDFESNLEIDDRGISSGSDSLQVTFQKGSHYGTSLHYKFDEAGYADSEELHARYYLRFSETFDLPRGAGGKLPGPAGTYGRAGWGGRRADGTNGWSARMYFTPSDAPERPIQLSSYVYHAEMDGRYGDIFEWDESAAGRLELGKWHRIDNYIRLNTPGKNDGVLRGWVNGERTLDVTDLRFRDVCWLRINQYWFDCYWGGSSPSPTDNRVYFDRMTLFSEHQHPNEWAGTETGMTPRPETSEGTTGPVDAETTATNEATDADAANTTGGETTQRTTEATETREAETTMEAETTNETAERTTTADEQTTK